MQTAATSSILISGYRIAYEQYGEGSPIWLLHGTPSYSYEWRKVIPSLVQKGIKSTFMTFLDMEHPKDHLKQILLWQHNIGFSVSF